MMTLTLKRSTWLLALIALFSCVTVNIYFPAAAAEKAADQIIEDIWNAAPPKPAKPQAKVEGNAARQLLLGILTALTADAHAQNVDFNASSPEVEQIKARMAKRFGELQAFLDSGAVGLTADGLVAVRDANAAPMADRGRMNQLVNAENADRKALYQAIAKANNQPG
ncbi:MAG: DUF1318 domain-containing protein, partial [Cardiobacteriaceae bacterium]|nr:DUF1318 domain-containing protein [Cardiobacteriaceae bacterium]